MAARAKKKQKNILTYNECMRELKDGKLRNLYLLYGEEDFLLKHLRKTITELALDPAAAELDGLTIDAKGKASSLEFSSLRNMLRTPPFLSPRRVIVIENSGLFAGGTGAYFKAASALFADANDGAVLIFQEEKVDKRSRKMLNALLEHGVAAECDAENLAVLIAWSRQYLQRYKINLLPQAAESLVERCQRSMTLLRQELQKLGLACREEGRTTIDEAYVDAVCIEDIRGRIFDLSDAVAAGQAERALQLYHNLLEQKNAPQFILFMLARHFRQLLTAQHSADKRELMQALGCGRFVADKLWRQKNCFTPKQARTIYLLCAESDWAIKSGQNDEKSALELLLLQALRPPED